jgi:hypothetical protein
MQGVSVNCVVDIGYFGNTPEITVNKVAHRKGRRHVRYAVYQKWGGC